ncbi:MAG: 3-isopropylmalate dehydrogenase [Bifidobacteriaceae bacterium]|jgi:3-isopropylmalate dehydrogenase|nr:3-isopropylmalate dehydrogenase [Bifidobacteriaceae bacterium]
MTEPSGGAGRRRELDLAVIPGDGIGPEVVEQGLLVLQAALEPEKVAVRVTPYNLGAARWHATGETLPDNELDGIGQHQAILLGAVGDPSVPSGVLERGLLLKLRFAFDQYINLRPAKLFGGVSSPLADPGLIDFLVVREGTEGPYSGNGGVVRFGTEQEIATEVSVNTAYGAARTVRYAFELAAGRPRRRLTLVHKHNVLVHAGHLWRRAVDATAADYPQVEVDYLHVDAATIFMVTDPSRFDVIVTDNLFGDILTDLAGAITGGIGLAASGNINPDGVFPSMFEPVHGSAPDIAGLGQADPTATVLSVSLMLRHLGFTAAAGRVDQAVEADLALRGPESRTTTQVGDSLLALVKSAL